MNYEPVIGLEIHVQLKTRSKMFCSSSNNPDVDEPNVNICEVCTGQPGSLPVANEEAIRKAILVGLALNCEIPEYSKFDRKNYFYPDLPKGYQISQYDQPLCVNGRVGTIRITRAHLEEDAGKLIHEGEVTLVDLNRAGVPLLEIVTEPDFKSPVEARQFLQNLRNIIRYLGVSDADMEKGHLRCDANISVRKAGETKLPDYKVELKNLNSFKSVFDALNYEVKRQTEALEEGRQLMNETRGWNGAKTVSQRVKEEAHDYRYFPEPDLPILHFSKAYIEKLRAEIPELPEPKRERFIAEFGISVEDADVLTSDKNLAGFFEEVVSELQEWFSSEGREGEAQKFAKLAVNWIIGDFQALLKVADVAPGQSKVTAENLAELIKMVDQGQVSGTAAKQVLAVMFEKGGDPSNIVQDEGLAQVSSETAIEQAIDKVLMEHQKAIEDYRAGKQRSFGFLVGQVMKGLSGKGNPKVINEILRKKLTE
ncbi:MAG: Asp-tRNA(Asn)/Glu-tRNA(Gln) amidotransferase subunit GatB [bacterium]|nr:Asp-tRNA(Asn)/Glu-tRNA(Gln) amidotransferase subunit GatB [bacterium]